MRNKKNRFHSKPGKLLNALEAVFVVESRSNGSEISSWTVAELPFYVESDERNREM
jgi:hypothetical protein